MTDASLALHIHEAPMSGVMISAELPGSMHELLGVPKPVKPLHITLMYLGKAAKITQEDAAAIAGAVRRVCAETPSLAGTVGAQLGSFPAGEDGVPHWASVDIPGLVELRAHLKEAVIEAGFAFKDFYPTFNPHVTLGFAPEGEPGPITECQAVNVVVEALEIAYGPDGAGVFEPHAGAATDD